MRVKLSYNPKFIPVDGNPVRMFMHYVHGDKIIYRGVEFLFQSVGYDCKEWFESKIVDLDELLNTNMKIPLNLNGYPVK